MKKFLVFGAVLCLCGACLAGCGEQSPAAGKQEPEVSIDYSEFVEPELESETVVSRCVPEDTVSSIMGKPMVYVNTDENGTAIYWEDGGVDNVRINMKNSTREDFDEMIAALSVASEPVTGVGDTAVWVDDVELMAYGNGYAVDVIVTGSQVPAKQKKAMRIATLALNNALKE